MKPFIFNPQPDAIAALFGKWLPLYVAQRRMDDEEAKPLQGPLADLEAAIYNEPIRSLQDFFLYHAAHTCMGSLAADYSAEATDLVCSLAVTEARERESLLALIDQHIETEAEFDALLDLHKDSSAEFAAAGGDELSDRGISLLFSIAAHPATSFETVRLKGRYFAARRLHGDIAHDVAYAFVASFLDQREGV